MATRGRGARKRRTARRQAMRVSARNSLVAAPDVSTEEFPDAAEAEFDLSKLEALAAADAAAAMADCAACDHAYTDHLGTAGPCTVDGCSCGSYEAAAEAEVTVGEAYLRVRPDMSMFRDEIGAAVEKAFQDFQFFQFTDGGGSNSNPFVSLDAVTDTLPEQHQPGETMPPRRRGPAVPDAPPPASAAVAWTAIFAPEGKLTSDGRAFAPGSITWRELPLTLMAMTETSEGGHIGAEVAGRIDRIWRDEAAGLIRAAGVFADTEYGSLVAGLAAGDPAAFGEALRASLVGNETLRGVSVDLAVGRYEVGPRSDWFDEDGNWIGVLDADGNWQPASSGASEEEGPSLLDILFADDADSIAVVLEAEIGMTTVCPFPAFAEAKIAVGDSLTAGANPAIWTATGQAGWTIVQKRLGAVLTASDGLGGESVSADCGCGTEALTASAAGMVAERPPAAWFEWPQFEFPAALTVTDEGRIFGHAALWESCHIGIPGRCQPPPPSHSDYAYFHLGEVVCDNSSRVSCGTITLDTGHAENGLGRIDATRHYDNTGTAVAYVKAGEDEFGIWVAGTLRPDVPEEKASLLRGAKLSGDWRKVDGNLELVALLTVNVPGFPVPRSRQLVASAADGTEEVLSLTAAGIPIFEADIDPADLERFEALRAHAEFAALAAEAA